MNRKEAIEAIKNNTKLLGFLFSGKPEDELAEVKLEAIKLKEGDMMVDVQGELAPGTKVITSSSTGSQDAADSQYDLSNGQSFTTKGGKIDKVIADGKNADADSEDMSDDSSDEDMAEATATDDSDSAAQDSTNTAALQALADKITEMDTMISAIKDALSGKASKEDMSAIGESFKVIQSAFEVLADTPAEFTKVDRSVEAKDNKAKKLDAIAALANRK